MTGIRLRAWEGSRTLHSACLDVAGTAACLDAARERAEGLRERGQVSGLSRGPVPRRFGTRGTGSADGGRVVRHHRKEEFVCVCVPVCVRVCVGARA